MTAHTATPQIITFYSYKGGTGRTMAVANVAWILASNGLRVLAVDWDLESPGLHRYFHPFLRDKQLRSTTGVIDLVRDYALPWPWRRPSDLTDDWIAEHTPRCCATRCRWTGRSTATATVDFLAAGRQDRAYSQTVSTFDWGNFYDRLGGAAFLEALRARHAQHYDYVLIDSRTGLSDTAGICTVAAARRGGRLLHDEHPEHRGRGGGRPLDPAASARGDPVRLLPVPMRVEDAEQFKLEAGREYATRLLRAVPDRPRAATSWTSTGATSRSRTSPSTRTRRSSRRSATDPGSTTRCWPRSSGSPVW